MINEIIARKYCAEDISLIENYEAALTDDKCWVIHHRLETSKYKDRSRSEWIDRAEDVSKDLLKMFGLYYNRPAAELIFMTKSDHMSLHKKGKLHSEDHKNNIAKSMIGHAVTDECKRKMRDARKRYWENKKKITKL